MKKKYIGAVYKLRKTFALFLCLLEEKIIGWLAYGWLLGDVVGDHYTNAIKRTQTIELFRLMIVLNFSFIANSY